jgi:hypothetical protein
LQAGLIRAKRHRPPLALFYLLEEKPQARPRLGLGWGRKLPRGLSFERGHPYRFGDPRRPQALAEAQARREKGGGNRKRKD